MLLISLILLLLRVSFRQNSKTMYMIPAVLFLRQMLSFRVVKKLLLNNPLLPQDLRSSVFFLYPSSAILTLS